MVNITKDNIIDKNQVMEEKHSLARVRGAKGLCNVLVISRPVYGCHCVKSQ